MNRFAAALLLFVVVASTASAEYLPVVFVHGFTGSNHDWDTFISLLHAAHPSQATFALDVDNKWASLKPLATQVADTRAALRAAVAGAPAGTFSRGFHLVGHSQGGLISRAILMELDQDMPNVTSYVSLAGIQGGFFGDCSLWWGKNLTCAQATAVMYTELMQKTLSAANFWRTPIDHAEYLAKNTFLPVLDNEVHPDPARTERFLRPQALHFFASPGDEVIKPWCTSVFDFVAADFVTCVPAEQQPTYVKDTFGLRTAVTQGKLFRHVLPGLKHTDWLDKADVINEHLIPLLY